MQRNNLYGLLDQAVSSAQNFALLAVVARGTSASSFGAFSVAYAATALAVGLGQALFGEAALIHLGANPRAAKTMSGTIAVLTIFVALASGLSFLFASHLLGGELGHLLRLLSLTIGALLFQDIFRFLLIAQQRAGSALVSDLVWTGAWLALIAIKPRDPYAHLACWSGTAAIGALVGLLALQPTVEWRSIANDTRQISRLSLSLVIEWLFLNGSVQLVVFALAGIVGLAATAGLRAAQSVYGPVSTLINAIRLVFIREIADRSGASDAQGAIRLALAISLICGCAAAVVATFVLVTPESLGMRLYGESWSLAVPLLLPIGLQRTLSGVSTGASAYLRGTGRVNEAIGARTVGITIETALAIGVSPLGILPSVYGLLAGTTATTAGIWAFTARAFGKTNRTSLPKDHAMVAIALVRTAPALALGVQVRRVYFDDNYANYVSLRTSRPKGGMHRRPGGRRKAGRPDP